MISSRNVGNNGPSLRCDGDEGRVQPWPFNGKTSVTASRRRENGNRKSGPEKTGPPRGHGGPDPYSASSAELELSSE